MKTKFKLLALCLTTLLVATSCFSTRVYVGNVSPKDPLVKVNSIWNHHLIAGLVPLANTKVNPDAYVGGAKNYVVKTNTTFLNYLVGGLTGGIYTPTKTTFYVPYVSKEAKEQSNQ